MVILSHLNSDKILSPTAVALGFFDGVHIGHQSVINSTIACKDKGLSSCVLTFSVDHEAPASKAGFKILTTDRLKAQILKNMGVEYLFCPTFEEIKNLSPRQFVVDILKNSLNAKSVSCGGDFRFGTKASAGVSELREICAENYISVDIISPVKEGGLNISSSRIRDCIKQGDIKKANKLLGRPYTIDFEVIHGRKLGRTLNFPTINQKLPEVYVVPKFGVYASAALVEGKLYSSVSNIGIKPTVGGTQTLAETYILDYSGDLYGMNVNVGLIDFIRPEEKFESIEILRQNIAADVEKARQISMVYISSLQMNK